jgi:nitrile hydratase accessory protein
MKSNSDLPDLPELPGASSEPVFNEPWEASAFAIAVCLNQAGLFSWNEWVEIFSKEIRDAEAANSQTTGQYYHTWFAALEKLVVDRHILEKQAIDLKQKNLRDHPPPHDHHAHRAPIAIG